MKGIITDVMTYALEIDLGEGRRGFIFGQDLSWSSRAKTTDYKVGDEIEALLLKVQKDEFDDDYVLYNLGLKQMTEDPWLTITNRYSVGQVVTGTVIEVPYPGWTRPYIFVELERGIEGTVHWTQACDWANQPGSEEKIEVRIEEIDTKNKLLRLSEKKALWPPKDLQVAG